MGRKHEYPKDDGTSCLGICCWNKWAWPNRIPKISKKILKAHSCKQEREVEIFSPTLLGEMELVMFKSESLLYFSQV